MLVGLFLSRKYSHYTQYTTINRYKRPPGMLNGFIPFETGHQVNNLLMLKDRWIQLDHLLKQFWVLFHAGLELYQGFFRLAAFDQEDRFIEIENRLVICLLQCI